jgi:hypothetical protein
MEMTRGKNACIKLHKEAVVVLRNIEGFYKLELKKNSKQQAIRRQGIWTDSL